MPLSWRLCRRGCTFLHGSRTFLHGSRTFLHGSRTCLHGSRTFLHGSRLSGGLPDGLHTVDVGKSDTRADLRPSKAAAQRGEVVARATMH